MSGPLEAALRRQRALTLLALALLTLLAWAWLAQGAGMGMEPRAAFDPFLTPERAIEMGVEKADLDTLLARADFITLHTPLTDQTRNILSRENLAKTKPGVRIVNCARGGLIACCRGGRRRAQFP